MTLQANNPEGSAKSQPGNHELRFHFVEMLFALAIAEVAVFTSHLERAPGAITDKVPGITHLILATVVIATSWLGWNASRWRKERDSLPNPFSWDFLGLLLDVLLVILYFVLVRSAEVTENEPYRLEETSSLPEARWLLVIFGVYAIWDVFSDVVKGFKWKGTIKFLALLFASTFCSLVCTLLILLVFYLSKDCDTWLRTVELDIALLASVLLFRSIKPLVENNLRLCFPTLQEFSPFEEARPDIPNAKIWVIALAFIYVIAVGIAVWGSNP